MVSQSNFLKYRREPTPEERIRDLEGQLSWYREMSASDEQAKDRLKEFISSILPELPDIKQREAREIFRL